MARQVSIDELKHMAADARESVWEQAQAYDREPKVYLHWSAGHRYNQIFEDYHVNIDGDGRLYVTGDLDEVKSHTWHRNTGAVGISLCCGYGATTASLGNEGPTPAQIEAMAQAIAAVADGLWLTVDKAHVLTHGEAADNEDGVWCHEEYGPKSTVERWDLEYLGTSESPDYNPWATDGSRGGDVLRGKAAWYQNQAKGSHSVANPEPAPAPSASQRAKYFSAEEMMCHGAAQGDCNCGVESANMVDDRFLELLDQLRENVGGPLEVSCMYRCPAHNAAVGGVPNSQHALGTAADVQTPNYPHCNTPEQLKWYAEQLPFDGVGLYDWGVHVDVREGGIDAGVRW